MQLEVHIHAFHEEFSLEHSVIFPMVLRRMPVGFASGNFPEQKQILAEQTQKEFLRATSRTAETVQTEFAHYGR